MANFVISAMLVWLAVNIAFVVLRLRATRHPATPEIDRPSQPYPGAVSVHSR